MKDAPKPRFARALAIEAAEEIVEALTPFCHRIIVAGSLRRQRQTVGDVEILYIPRLVREPDPADMFAFIDKNLVDVKLGQMLADGILGKRRNVNGSEMWGEKNKLGRHVASEIPVDLFSTTEEAWWNYLVCRTGPADSNTAIANAAIKKGWKWHPYEEGFGRMGKMERMDSEEAVFAFVGLPYREPWQRA